MREIKFRGRVVRRESGPKWVCGHFMVGEADHGKWVALIVGPVEGTEVEEGRRSFVDWNDDHGSWSTGGGTNTECREWKTVIGNIRDQPELLQVVL